MALTKITSDGITDGTITGTDLATNIDLVDNQFLRIGNSQDLQIHHDGSNSFIKDTGTGVLAICSNEIQINNAANTHLMIKAVQSGAAELYHNNSKKFETTTNGTDITGNSTYAQLKLKTSDGSNTGGLYGNSSGLFLLDGQDHQFIHCVKDGEVIIKHDNSNILRTYPSGVQIFGALFADSVDLDDNKKILLGTGDDLEIYHSGADSIIDEVGTGQLKIRNSGSNILTVTGTGIIINGTITVDSTVDGVDIAARDTLFGGLTSSSGVLTNGVTATTQSAGDNSTKVATTAYTDTAISNLVDSSPSALNTLNELAAALGDDANFSTTITNSIATKLANIVEDTSPQLGGDLDTNSHEILLDDNHAVKFGASSDLQIYHNNSLGNSWITNSTGVLNIRSDGFAIRSQSDAASYINITDNAGVDLYYNNSKKLETTSEGVLIGNGGLHLGDNNKIEIGNSDDLQIYHNGTKSIIDNNTGDLSIETTANEVHNVQSEFQVKVKGGDEDGLKVITDGAVELYYNNSLKFETRDAGATLFGDFYMGDDRKIRLGDATGGDLRLYHDGSNSFITDSGTGSLVIQASTLAVNNAAGTEQMMKAVENGAVELNYDGSKKFETVNTGVYVYGDLGFGIGTTGNLFGGDSDKILLGNGTDLQIYHDGSNSYIDNHEGDLYLRGDSDNIAIQPVDGENAILCDPNGAVRLYYDNSQKLLTTSTGVTFDGTGAILVPKGTTAQRPTGANGHVRYNETTNALEGYINGGWVTVKSTGLAEDGKYANNTQATADDLWAYWDCDSTSTTRAGGDSGAATLYGVTSQTGKISNSWDRGTSASNGVLLTSMPTGNNFTLMFQLYRTDSTIHSSADGAAIVHLDGALSGGTEGSVILGYDGSNGTDLRFGGNGWVNDGETVLGNFSNNNWYHMVITRSSGTTWKFYLDGSLITTRTETMAVGSSWMLGNYSRVDGNGNTNNHYFRGRFDEIAVWDRTLSAAEISSIYTAQDAGTALL